MEAALETLSELPCKGRRVAVLGDMAEVGADSEAAPRRKQDAARRNSEWPSYLRWEIARTKSRGVRATPA